MPQHQQLDIGTRLGERYELTDQIGEGGFGTIYRARQLNIDRDVAVKVLPPKFADVDNVVERFRREARLASRLRHPNTITIHDYGRHDDSFFIVMEYLKGEDLAQRLDREATLSLQTAVRVATQTLKSLREAHQFGIVHRDLKPENIFLTRMDGDDNYVKVLDFGIAKLATHDPDWLDVTNDSGRNLTVQGNTVGTPAYMSPEQAAGEQVDVASDLYTVGLILFEMVNGRPPFEKSRPLQTMRAQLFDPVPSFPNEQLRNTLFETVVRTALAKDPEDRFEDADEFLDALDDDLTSRSLGAVTLSSHGTADSTEADHPADPPTDEVPFEVVPDDADDQPPGPISTDDGAESSSIITVLDEPDDDEVIVLTKKKTPEPQQAADPTAEVPQADSAPPDSNDAGEDDDNQDWSWQESHSTTDASGSQILTDYTEPTRRRRFLIAAALLLAATVAIFALLLATGVITLPV